MADEGNADTFEYPLNGRVLILKKLSPGRVAMLDRFWQTMTARAAASKDAEEVATLNKRATDTFWEVIESQFINPEDLAFVQTEILMGRLAENQLGPILTGGHTAATFEDDADPAPAKKPGRKAPAKKPARKAAAPRAQKG